MAKDTLDTILRANDKTWSAAAGPMAPPDAVFEQTLRHFIQLHNPTRKGYGSCDFP